MGQIREMFVQVTETHEPINDPKKENLYITKSYDATSHFETSDIDVLNIYETIVGEKLDLNQAFPEDDDEWAHLHIFNYKNY